MVHAITGETHTQTGGGILVSCLDGLELTLEAVELPLVIALEVPVPQNIEQGRGDFCLGTWS